MLILTRRTNETVVIGEDIHITVLRIKGNQIRLGINAPKSTSVHREEIFLRIKEKKEIGPFTKIPNVRKTFVPKITYKRTQNARIG